MAIGSCGGVGRSPVCLEVGLTGDGLGLDRVVVGQTDGDGMADGTLEVAGNLGGFAEVTLGRTGLNSTGHAVGDLTVDGGAMGPGVNGFFLVGLGAGDGDIKQSHPLGQVLTLCPRSVGIKML